MRGHRAWVILAAVVVGWLIVPRAVSAVGTIVTIQGGNGSTKANVTHGKQLQVAEAAPSSFREFADTEGDTACHVIATIPSNKGFVIRSISLNVLQATTNGFQFLAVFPAGTCNGKEIFSAPTHVLGAHPVSLDPGFAIAPGGKLAFQIGGTPSTASVFVWGYFVPASDVPATTQIG